MPIQLLFKKVMCFADEEMIVYRKKQVLKTLKAALLHVQNGLKHFAYIHHLEIQVVLSVISVAS